MALPPSAAPGKATQKQAADCETARDRKWRCHREFDLRHRFYPQPYVTALAYMDGLNYKTITNHPVAMTIPPNTTFGPAPTPIKKLPSFLAVLIGIVLVLGGMLHFVIVTGFPHSWLQQDYVFTVPRLGPTQAVFDSALHLASVLGWVGFGMLFWGLVADGCILKQPRSKQVFATLFGIITLFCAILQLRVCAHWYWIVHYTLWAGYSFDPASMFFTFPAALVCTVLALFLVGLRKSWLAWISLCLFALPLWQTLSMIPTWQDYISLKYGP